MIDCGYTLEPPWRKNKQNSLRYTPAYPSFDLKVVYKVVFIIRKCYRDGTKTGLYFCRKK